MPVKRHREMMSATAARRQPSRHQQERSRRGRGATYGAGRRTRPKPSRGHESTIEWSLLRGRAPATCRRREPRIATRFSPHTVDREVRVSPSNENKMSDGGRDRASLGVKVWKSSQKWSVRRSAVRSIVCLGPSFSTRKSNLFGIVANVNNHGASILLGLNEHLPLAGFLDEASVVPGLGHVPLLCLRKIRCNAQHSSLVQSGGLGGRSK